MPAFQAIGLCSLSPIVPGVRSVLKLRIRRGSFASSDGQPIHPFSAGLHPGGEIIVFIRERCIVDLPGAPLGEGSMSAAGDRLTAAFDLARNPVWWSEIPRAYKLAPI